jgi:hypothetical protein
MESSNRSKVRSGHRNGRGDSVSCSQVPLLVLRSNSAFDRTTFRRRYAALRSTGAAGQRER